MKVRNTTHYPTAALRTIICRAHANLRRHQGKLRTWDRAEFRVLRRLRRTHTSGHAYLGGSNAVLTLPCPRVETRKVYRLVWHEMQYLYGYEHRQMGSYYPPDDETACACDGLPEVLEEQAPKAKPPVDRQARELPRIEAGIQRWTTKAKRAETALKKLRKRRAYYARTLAQRDTAAA